MNHIEELQAFMGKHFDDKKMIWPAKTIEKELRNAKTAERWWKSREALYLYLHLQTSLWRKTYTTFVLEQAPPCRVLDYHAGTGAFGLQLAERGYDVNFADTRGEIFKFLAWRVKQRKLKSKVYDLDKDEIPHHDLVISFDRIHQYPEEQQFNFIRMLASLGDRVIINLNDNLCIHEGIFYPVDREGLRGLIGEHYEIVRSVVRNHYQNLIDFRVPARAGAKDEEVADG